VLPHILSWIYQSVTPASQSMARLHLTNRILATFLPLPLALLIANFPSLQISGTSSLLVALVTSLVVQEVLCRCLLFKDENQDFSRRLGGSEKLITISSHFGPLLTSIMILLAPFIVAAIFLSFVAFIVPEILNLSVIGWLFLFISLGLLLDPLTSPFVESTLSAAAVASGGYLSVILIGIGAASLVTDNLIFQLLICLALLNVRITFMLEFGYKKHTDITSFAPSVLALFFAMIPNLQSIIVRLMV
jgi:hypothetical protein